MRSRGVAGDSYQGVGPSRAVGITSTIRLRGVDVLQGDGGDSEVLLSFFDYPAEHKS